MLLAALLTRSAARAQAPSFVWAATCGGYDTSVNDTQTSAQVPASVAIAGQGQVYVVGSFTGTAAFGSFTLTSLGLADAFVAKLDAQGHYL